MGVLSGKYRCNFLLEIKHKIRKNLDVLQYKLAQILQVLYKIGDTWLFFTNIQN